jgi:tRNA U34 2-thiouridine synthase MnmA/TrmU
LIILIVTIDRWHVKVNAKVRYRHRSPAELRMWAVRKDARVQGPTEAITPGQAVVFYGGDGVLGGG